MAPIKNFKPENDNFNEHVPYIIGMSLMGIIITILTISLIICYCSRKKKYAGFNTSDNVHYVAKISKDDKETLFPLQPKRETKIDDDRQNIPLPNIESFNRLNSDVHPTMLRRSYTRDSRRNKYRRASVPMSLDTLHEVSASKETSIRKKSLSNDCVKNLSELERYHDSLDMPESGPNSVTGELDKSNLDFRLSDLNYMRTTNASLRYSIYDDQKLNVDDNYSRFGKLHFSLFYNIDTKCLEVTMKKAQHLNGMRYKGKNRFYIKLKLKKKGIMVAVSNNTLSGIPENITIKSSLKKCTSDNYATKKFRTSIQADFCNPNFEETFQFTSVTVSMLNEYMLEMTVKEETPKFLERNKTIGIVELPLSDARLVDGQESISDLIRDIQPIEFTESSGTLTLGLQYVKSQSLLIVTPYRLELNNRCQEATTPVQLEMYLRTIDTVVSHEKINLPELGYLNNDIEKIVQRFNLDYCFLNSMCLVILVYARIRNCPKTPCGKLIMGPIRFTDGPGLAHWVDMSVGTQEPIVKAHKLY